MLHLKEAVEMCDSSARPAVISAIGTLCRCHENTQETLAHHVYEACKAKDNARGYTRRTHDWTYIDDPDERDAAEYMAAKYLRRSHPIQDGVQNILRSAFVALSGHQPFEQEKIAGELNAVIENAAYRLDHTDPEEPTEEIV